MKRVHVCPKPGCPNLMPCPVEGHTRPANAPWSQNRDHKQHLHQRRALIRQLGPICQRCGHQAPKSGQGLDMHHVTPTQVVLVCRNCHLELDPHARNPQRNTHH